MKKFTFWKSLFLLCALIVGSTSAWATDVTDQLNKSDFAATGSSYANFSNVQKNTAVYAGRTSVQNSSVGMKRNTSEGAGIFTTTSGGVAKSLKFTWTSTSSRTLQVWGKNSAYSLANTKNQSNFGTKIAEVTYDSNNKTPTLTLNSTTEYEYILIVPSSSDMLSIKDIEITWEVEDNTKVKTPNITGAQNFLESTTVGISCDTEGATIQYSTDNGNTWNTFTDEFNLTATTTVKAKATKSGLTDSDESSATFTKRTPVTVTEALTAITALENNGTSAAQCVRGIVSTAGSLSSGKINYYISTDGTTANQLYIFGGKGLNNANFTASTDIKVGDEVVVFGTYKKYVSGNTTTPEVTDGYLLSITKKTDPTFTLDPTEVNLKMGTTETADVTLTTNTDGTITCGSSNEDVATVALKSAGVYTITAQTAGSATITIKSLTSDTYYPASKTVTVTVTDTREDAGISFTNSSITKTWGQSFTGQELTNTNNLDVTWSSTDESVATVNTEGTVTVLKAGTTTIKATFAGNATYKAAIASYSLTVNKANAGLSFSQTTYEFDLNDESFTGVAVNNPNNLPVTYTSNNEDVAVVIDGSSYEILVDASVVGTATITASFTGNDNYNSGSASYTIKVIDSYAKGGKNNPYSVAEVEALTEDKTGVYVTGYIVGCVNSSNSKAYKTTTSEWNNANLLLSDDRDISFTEGTSIGKTTADNLIPVQLPTNDLKNTWGISITSGAVIGYKILLKGNGLDYFTGKGVKSTSEINAVTAPVTISTAEYATYNNANYALDFSETGITVYTAQDKETTVGLTEVTTGQIPANTPVVLHKTGANGTAINVPVIASADAIEGTNDLRVSTGTDVDYMYVLAMNPTIGFYPWTGTNLPAGKIYLQGKASYGAREFLGFDANTSTAINNVVVKTIDENAPMYNLAGQRVNKSYKGVVIVNGKKYMNK